MTKSQTFELKAARVTKETWPKPPEKHSDDRTARTFCDLPIAGSDARGISYWPQPTLPGFWRVMPDADDADAAEEFTPAHGGRRVRPRAGRTDPTLALKLDALLTDVLAPPEGGTDARDDVPVVELPATGPGNLMTIIYSGRWWLARSRQDDRRIPGGTRGRCRWRRQLALFLARDAGSSGRHRPRPQHGALRRLRCDRTQDPARPGRRDRRRQSLAGDVPPQAGGLYRTRMRVTPAIATTIVARPRPTSSIGRELPRMGPSA